MTKPVKIAVVGAGQMGANHARVYANLKDVELVGVVDTDPDKAAAAVARHGGRVFDDVTSLQGLVDAVSITVPSSLHVHVGLEALAAGLHCLIEKPLASSSSGARQLTEAAADAGRILAVGHIERFNPAVEQVAQILAGGEAALAFSTRRMSAVSSRITDVDVVSDLMIHDLDIIMFLAATDVTDVAARGVHSAGGALDYVTALISFGSGAMATLSASRITQNKIRTLDVTTPDRLFSVDYSAQELEIFRQGRVGAIGDSTFIDGQYLLDVGTERVFVRRTEPLVAELAHFVACVRDGEVPRVTGETASRVIELAEAVTRSAEGVAS